MASPLADPVLELHDSNGAVVATNDSWKIDQEAADRSHQRSADKRRGSRHRRHPRLRRYTAIESGKNGGTGVGLVEVYNLH